MMRACPSVWSGRISDKDCSICEQETITTDVIPKMISLFINIDNKCLLRENANKKRSAAEETVQGGEKRHHDVYFVFSHLRFFPAPGTHGAYAYIGGSNPEQGVYIVIKRRIKGTYSLCSGINGSVCCHLRYYQQYGKLRAQTFSLVQAQPNQNPHCCSKHSRDSQ